MIKITKGSRAFYTNISGGRFEIIQIILEVKENHKDYEREGKYQ
jgi:hypothetical protein